MEPATAERRPGLRATAEAGEAGLDWEWSRHWRRRRRRFRAAGGDGCGSYKKTVISGSVTDDMDGSCKSVANSFNSAGDDEI